MTQYPASRVPTHVGPAPWRELLAEPPQSYPALSNTQSADITIIGAGFAGLAAAQRLLQIDNNIKVCLIEASRIAEGAAGRNSGFMIDLPHDLSTDHYAGGANADKKLIGLNRQAINFAKAAVEQHGIDPRYFDPIGKINGAASTTAEKHNTDYSTHLTSLNEPFEILDKQTMIELTGSEHYLSGVYTPGTVLLQPAGYSLGLAAGLSRSMKIYEQSPVTSIQKDGANWSVNTAQGNVVSEKVIMATNGHLESFGFAKRRLMHIFLYASMTKEFNAKQSKQLGGQAKWGITPSDPMGTTVRRIVTPAGGTRYITRTCAHYLPEMQTSQARLKKAAAVHQQKFDARFPSLVGTDMEYQWAGHLCLTHNGVSVTQELDKGLFSACVQNGLGATRGTLTGICAAEHSLQVKTEIGAFFDANKPARLLPPALIGKPVANALLRWREWRATNE